MEMVKSNEWFTRTVECERERDRGACRVRVEGESTRESKVELD